MARFARALLGWAMAACAGTVVAETLPDPTRPADYSGGATAAARVERPSGPVLQSTLVSPLHKRAVIDGKSVGVGDSINGVRVIDIRPYEVILRRGERETTSLRLMPKLVKETKLAKEKGTPE